MERSRREGCARIAGQGQSQKTMTTIRPTQILEGDFWPEPVRVLTVRSIGSRTKRALVGVRTHQFDAIIQRDADIAMLGVAWMEQRDMHARRRCRASRTAQGFAPRAILPRHWGSPGEFASARGRRWPSKRIVPLAATGNNDE